MHMTLLLWVLVALLCQKDSLGWIRSASVKNRIIIHQATSLSIVNATPTVTRPKRTTGIPDASPTVNPDIADVPSIFKETRDIQQEMDTFLSQDHYYVILYDDPVNKRAYVANCLMDIFNWTEVVANDVMMRAHNFGYAITGEFSKAVAEEYCQKLRYKRLSAETRKAEGSDGHDG